MGREGRERQRGIQVRKAVGEWDLLFTARFETRLTEHLPLCHPLQITLIISLVDCHLTRLDEEDGVSLEGRWRGGVSAPPPS